MAMVVPDKTPKHQKINPHPTIGGHIFDVRVVGNASIEGRI